MSGVTRGALSILLPAIAALAASQVIFWPLHWAGMPPWVAILLSILVGMFLGVFAPLVYDWLEDKGV